MSATAVALRLPPQTSLPRTTLLRELPKHPAIYERMREADGPVVAAQLGPRSLTPMWVFVLNAAGARDMLTSQTTAWDKENPVYDEFAKLAGPSSFSMPDSTWLPRRRALQPIMTRRHVDGFAGHMDKATRAHTAGWPAQGRVDIVEATRELTLDVLGRCLFAMDLANRTDDVTPALDRTLRRVTRRGFSPVPIPNRWRLPRSLRDRDVLRQVVDEAVALAVARQQVGDGEQGSGGELVDLLLTATDPESGLGLTSEEIRDELITFLAAGHDTTATALAATLWHLARHPDVQDRVRDEVRALNADEITPADLARLPYTRQVLDESLRLCPPGVGAGRTCIADTRVGGYDIPAGWVGVMSIWALHRDPEVFDDPSRFDPDRFAPVTAKARDRWAYLPFGGGRRSCIGDHFATMEATIGIAGIVGSHRLSTNVGELPLSMPFTLTVKGPVTLEVQRC